MHYKNRRSENSLVSLDLLQKNAGDMSGTGLNGKSWPADCYKPVEWVTRRIFEALISPSHAWLAPREVINEAGYWDAGLLRNQDGEYFNRVILASDGVSTCKNTEVFYRNDVEGSISTRGGNEIVRSRLEALFKIHKNILSTENSPRTNAVCAMQLQKFLYYNHLELSKSAIIEAEQKIDMYVGTNVLPSNSTLYREFVRILGWQWAKSIRNTYHNLKGSLNK